MSTDVLLRQEPEEEEVDNDKDDDEEDDGCSACPCLLGDGSRFESLSSRFQVPVAPSLVELRSADNHAPLLCNGQEDACKRRNAKEPEVLGSH